jgi:L,D-transpeptidase YbiS
MLGDQILRTYVVSTGRAGVNALRGSGGTPRGIHVIRAKIGAGSPVGTVFAGRRATREIWPHSVVVRPPGHDWMLTRLLWLGGLEPGKNRGGVTDTLRRYIYLHGCADEDALGKPVSRGCIRMRNTDIVDLFDLVNVGTKVFIDEK